jgi:hypothetical protein
MIVALPLCVCVCVCVCVCGSCHPPIFFFPSSLGLCVCVCHHVVVGGFLEDPTPQTLLLCLPGPRCGLHQRHRGKRTHTSTLPPSCPHFTRIRPPPISTLTPLTRMHILNIGHRLSPHASPLDHTVGHHHHRTSSNPLRPRRRMGRPQRQSHR